MAAADERNAALIQAAKNTHAEEERRAAAEAEHETIAAGIPNIVTGNGDDPQPPDRSTHLPDVFWSARPELAHISQAARSRMIGRDALLGAVLARVAAVSSHVLRLPAIVGAPCGLTFYAALVGPSGASKSSASDTGADLIPCDVPWVADRLPIGSGEGLIESLFDVIEAEDDDGRKTRTKTQTRYGAIVYVDEGAVLGEFAQRRGSTLLSVLRSAYTHQTIGQANATAERRRILKGSEYVYGLIMGIQPELAGPLLDDTPAGTPQRFVWFAATDPNIPDVPPAWPGPLDWRPLDDYRRGVTVADAIRDEIRVERRAVMRGEPRDAIDAHRMLVRLKVATLLALLSRRSHVGSADWKLAGMVMDTSDAVRASIQYALALVARNREQVATAAHVRRELTVDDSREANALRSAAGSVGNLVRRHQLQHAHETEPGCTRNCATKAIAGKHRVLVSVDDVLTEAERRDWIAADGERWKPGRKRP